jgi:Protein phosphatase 2C
MPSAYSSSGGERDYCSAEVVAEAYLYMNHILSTQGKTEVRESVDWIKQPNQAILKRFLDRRYASQKGASVKTIEEGINLKLYLQGELNSAEGKKILAQLTTTRKHVVSGIHQSEKSAKDSGPQGIEKDSSSILAAVVTSQVSPEALSQSSPHSPRTVVTDNTPLIPLANSASTGAPIQSATPVLSHNIIQPTSTVLPQISLIIQSPSQIIEPVIDPQLGSWSWTPLPTHEPDPHDEFFCSAGKLPHGLRYVAARARGKKHKHEGTHCDDWYEVSLVGPWSLIAVSDGAGSKRISRVGARACTNEALSFLKQHLVDTPAPSLASRKEWTDALQRDDLGNFFSDELRHIQHALAGSVKASFAAVEQAFEKRKSDGSWNTTLERDPELKDFRSTILVSLMCPIHFDGERRVFCLSVQVGDGLTVMYSDSVPLTDPLPLGAKDSGEYSSETEFLVDFKKWAELPRKIAVTVTPFRMLVSMTDGIDDIYDPRSGRDYNWILGELVLNQISPLFRSAESVDKAIEDIGGVGVVKQAVKSATQPRSKRLMASPETTVRIMDIGEYAKALGKRVVDLITRPEWLLAAHRYSAPITDEQTIEQRLLSWIDGKDVKGEFDDRAIVILFPDDGIAL